MSQQNLKKKNFCITNVCIIDYICVCQQVLTSCHEIDYYLFIATFIGSSGDGLNEEDLSETAGRFIDLEI